jgi:phenylacetate-CoA ligase
LSADFEQLYSRLPVPLQNASCSLVGLHTRWTRYRRPFSHLLAEASERSAWSQERVAAMRDERLRAFVEHAARTTPFYKETLEAAGLSPADIRFLDDLSRLPILTKDLVQERGTDLVSTAVPTHLLRTVHTSGTTGGGLRFGTTLRAVQEQWATWWRYRRWHDIRRSTWCGLFAGRMVVPAAQRRPPFWRYNLAGKQLLFSGYHMSPANLPAYVAELRRRKPPWLHGYPSLLSLLAGHVLENGVDFGYPIRWITIGAENLLPQQAAVIERAFGVRPRQHYGMAEAVANFSECDQGRLHVDEDFAAVEFVPIGGRQFRVVGTNLTNPVTPLIRYDVLDVVTIDDETECSCGRPGRIVSSVDGRHEDYVVLSDGARLGRMDHIFKDMIRIREAQIRQEQAGEFTIAIVKGRGFSADDEERVALEVSKRVGNRARFSIDYVESLPRTRTGKLRLVVSEVGRSE